MTPKQLARHKAVVAAAPVHRPAGEAQHRAGLIPPAVLTVLLALAVVVAIAVVVAGVALR